eukprot:364397-Chlamydomonas_euryale.AAC.14
MDHILVSKPHLMSRRLGTSGNSSGNKPSTSTGNGVSSEQSNVRPANSATMQPCKRIEQINEYISLGLPLIPSSTNPERRYSEAWRSTLCCVPAVNIIGQGVRRETTKPRHPN